MSININSLSHSVISFFKESIPLAMKTQQKKVWMVASLALGFIAALSYSIFRNFNHKKVTSNDEEEPLRDKRNEKKIDLVG